MSHHRLLEMTLGWLDDKGLSSRWYQCKASLWNAVVHRLRFSIIAGMYSPW